MHIFVLAAQYPNLDKKVQPLYIKLVDQYNMQMEEAVRKIDMLYENVLWVPATQKIGMSPGETPLMPNGKLMAWPCKKYRRFEKKDKVSKSWENEKKSEKNEKLLCLSYFREHT